MIFLLKHENCFKIQLFLFFSLDKLGPTVFAPVKMDFVGNIKVTTYF